MAGCAFGAMQTASRWPGEVDGEGKLWGVWQRRCRGVGVGWCRETVKEVPDAVAAAAVVSCLLI
jgi:hypothetical protein